MKKNKNKKVKLRVIQKNTITGHPSYPFSQTKDKVKSIGFTHDKKEEKGKKEKLLFNINPDDKDDCYVKLTVEKQSAKFYKEKEEYKNYRIHPKDQPKINKIIRNNKKR